MPNLVLCVCGDVVRLATPLHLGNVEVLVMIGNLAEVETGSRTLPASVRLPHVQEQ